MEQNKGVSNLAGVLQGRTKAVTDKPSVIDVGEIQEDGSLLTNKFPIPIPKTDYMVCRSVLWGEVGDIFTQTQEIGKENSGVHEHEMKENGEHTHQVTASGLHTHEVEGEFDYEGEEGSFQGEASENGSHSHDLGTEKAHKHDFTPHQGHIHDVLVGKKFRSLQSGDRVLVAWIDSRDACVVDIIFKADSDLGKIYE